MSFLIKFISNALERIIINIFYYQWKSKKILVSVDLLHHGSNLTTTQPEWSG